jgi:hypothetical protein
VRVRADPGLIEVVPSQACPAVTVSPVSELQTWDGPLNFTATYRPEGTDILDCELALDVVIVDAPDGNPTCPAVPLSGSAFEASSGWTPCADRGDLEHSWSGVYGLSPDEVYMAGEQGRVARYEGDCTRGAVGTGENLVDLTDVWAHAFGPDGTERSLWAVGNRAIYGTVLQSTGEPVWTVEDESDRFTYGTVWGSDECAVYVGGQGIASDFPNGQRFDREGSEPFQVYRFDGTVWNLATDPLVDRPLHDVWATASVHVWAVGEQGAIYHGEGTDWIDESRSVGGTLYGVWATKTGEVLAVGESGLAWFFDGSDWIAQTPGTTEDLLGVWGSSATEIFVVGHQAVYRVGPTP